MSIVDLGFDSNLCGTRQHWEPPTLGTAYAQIFGLRDMGRFTHCKYLMSPLE